MAGRGNCRMCSAAMSGSGAMELLGGLHPSKKVLCGQKATDDGPEDG